DATRPTGVDLELESWMAAHAPLTEAAAEAPLSVIYTSGTTGLPKGVVRSPTTPEQRSETVAAVLHHFGLEPSMRTLIPAPMYHTAPNVHALFAAALGLDLTLLPRFEPELFL